MGELLTRKHTDLMLDTITENRIMHMGIRQISGVKVDGTIGVRTTGRPMNSDGNYIQYTTLDIRIEAEYQDRLVWEFIKRYATEAGRQMMYDDFYEQVNKLGFLKYEKSSGMMKHTDKSEKEVARCAVRAMFTELFKGEQFVHMTSDCCVCYDNTSDVLRCGHHLCLVCESAMKDLSCPLCRKEYTRCRFCKDDGQCECDDE